MFVASNVYCLSFALSIINYICVKLYAAHWNQFWVIFHANQIKESFNSYQWCAVVFICLCKHIHHHHQHHHHHHHRQQQRVPTGRYPIPMFKASWNILYASVCYCGVKAYGDKRHCSDRFLPNRQMIETHLKSSSDDESDNRFNGNLSYLAAPNFIYTSTYTTKNSNTNEAAATTLHCTRLNKIVLCVI